MITPEQYSEDFLNELGDFQKKFANYFNVASIIFDSNGKPITDPSGFTKFCDIVLRAKEEGKLSSNPEKSIEEIHTRDCAFFSDIADTIIPIKYNNKTISTWAVGRNPLGDISREKIDEVAKKIGMDADELWESCADIPTATQEEFDDAVYFLHATITTLVKMREQDEELKENIEKFELMTGIIAHDIRESLSIIVGYTELLEDRYASVNDKEFMEFISYIIKYSNRLKKTAEILIDLCGDKDNLDTIDMKRMMSLL